MAEPTPSQRVVDEVIELAARLGEPPSATALYERGRKDGASAHRALGTLVNRLARRPRVDEIEAILGEVEHGRAPGAYPHLGSDVDRRTLADEIDRGLFNRGL